jgi:hypothetical protein
MSRSRIATGMIFKLLRVADLRSVICVHLCLSVSIRG